MIKIAIDKGPLTSGHKVRGVGVYTREIIKALKKITKGKKNMKITPLDFSTQSSKLKAQNFDLIHYTYFHPYFLTMPLKTSLTEGRPTKTVVTIHDLILLIYPKQYPPGFKGRLRYLIQKRLVKGVDGVIAPSETSKKDIVRFLGVPAEKIQVVYEAPKEIFRQINSDSTMLHSIRLKYKLPEKFVLYVGDVNYNKNILGLAEGCKIAKIPLVILGKQAADETVDLSHPENRDFSKFLKKFSKDRNVLRLGYVADHDLVYLYNLAAVYCQPSFYEGFGLPVLEAMACGLPVVASKTQALVEIAGNSAIFTDPHDSKDIAKKINEAMRQSDLLKLRGARKVKEFSWERAAKETLEYYREVIVG